VLNPPLAYWASKDLRYQVDYSLLLFRAQNIGRFAAKMCGSTGSRR
jgi:hypothetical protein